MGVNTSNDRWHEFSNIKSLYGENWVGDLALIYPGMSSLLCPGHLVYLSILAVIPFYQLGPETSRLFQIF
jgi:hypothetical protein